MNDLGESLSAGVLIALGVAALLAISVCAPECAERLGDAVVDGLK